MKATLFVLISALAQAAYSASIGAAAYDPSVGELAQSPGGTILYGTSTSVRIKYGECITRTNSEGEGVTSATFDSAVLCKLFYKKDCTGIFIPFPLPGHISYPNPLPFLINSASCEAA